MFLVSGYKTQKRIETIIIEDHLQWTPHKPQWNAFIEAEWGPNGRENKNWKKKVIKTLIIYPIGKPIHQQSVTYNLTATSRFFINLSDLLQISLGYRK